MSFSGKCKDELLKQPYAARHCIIAELAGMLLAGGRLENEEGILRLLVQSDNLQVIERIQALLKSLFAKDNRRCILPVEGRKSLYYILPEDNDGVKHCLDMLKINYDSSLNMLPDGIIIQNTCCKRAFIRGAFLISGSVSSPEKTYHFEIVLISRFIAGMVSDAIKAFDMEAKIVIRKKYYVVYLKEGSQVSDILSLMGASVAMMDFENVRIVKEVRNSVNRQVNCETANLNKTVVAASKQVEDIIFLKEHYGLERLKPQLAQVAYARLDNPDMPLKELGETLNPPVGKSGVNHRLKKLKQIADDIRGVLPDNE